MSTAQRLQGDRETATGREAAGINYERLYAYRFRDVDQASRQAVWREIARYIHGRMGKPRRVLDPAAGRGEFISAVPAGERWGVDLVGQGVPESTGLTVIINDIMAAELPASYFDGVFVSNFLEHLADQDEVATVLGKLYSVMQPAGRIAIIGPNFKYCAREYFDCADHTVILSHVAVAEHLCAAGFDVSTVSARFLPYSFRGVLPPSPALTRTYLRTPVLWPLLGKQFLVLGRKPRLDAARLRTVYALFQRENGCMPNSSCYRVRASTLDDTGRDSCATRRPVSTGGARRAALPRQPSGDRSRAGAPG